MILRLLTNHVARGNSHKFGLGYLFCAISTLGLIPFTAGAAPIEPASTDKPSTDLICSGWDEVFIIKSTGDSTSQWTWRAADSKVIPKETHSRFRTTDECKPFGKFILITSSSGGVALVRRDDKRCVFFTFARNAHSACLLPQQRVAVAASTGGDKLLVFDRNKSGAKIKPLAQIPLKGAHGAHWDAQLKRLWALGEAELLRVQIKGTTDVTLVVEKRWKLPTFGGHDLSPCNDQQFLFVTTDTNVYRFDKKTGKFGLDDLLGKSLKIKSVDQHVGTGGLVYHQATAKTWWSDTIRFSGTKPTITLKGRRLYKVRWDVPGEIPK